MCPRRSFLSALVYFHHIIIVSNNVRYCYRVEKDCRIETIGMFYTKRKSEDDLFLLFWYKDSCIFSISHYVRMPNHPEVITHGYYLLQLLLWNMMVTYSFFWFVTNAREMVFVSEFSLTGLLHYPKKNHWKIDVWRHVGIFFSFTSDIYAFH